MTAFDKDNQPQGERSPQRAYRYSYKDVGEMCGRSGSACRQWFSRRGHRLDPSKPVESLRLVVEYASSVGVVGMRTIAKLAKMVSNEPPEAFAIVEKPVVSLEEVGRRYEGTMSDNMAAVLGAMGGNPKNVENEESEWETGRKEWIKLAERVEIGGGLDDDSEWGAYNSGVIKYGSGKRR